MNGKDAVARMDEDLKKLDLLSLDQPGEVVARPVREEGGGYRFADGGQEVAEVMFFGAIDFRGEERRPTPGAVKYHIGRSLSPGMSRKIIGFNTSRSPGQFRRNGGDAAASTMWKICLYVAASPGSA